MTTVAPVDVDPDTRRLSAVSIASESGLSIVSLCPDCFATSIVGVGVAFLRNDNDGRLIFDMVGHLIVGNDFASDGPTRIIPVSKSPIPSPINVANSASLFIIFLRCC